MNRIRFSIIALVAAVVFGHWMPAASAGEQLEIKYREQSLKILESLRSNGIKSVGVLKFSLRIGDGSFRENVGMLNTRLAQKLELALVISNPFRQADEARQVGIVRAASKVAATIEGATHLSAEGRNLLFSKPYRLAWNHLDETEVVPDAFIVGVAQIATDLSSMQIELMLLKKSDLSFTPIAKITVPTDLEDLMDIGESFTTHRIFDGGALKETDERTGEIEEAAIKEAMLVRTETIDKSTPQTST